MSSDRATGFWMGVNSTLFFWNLAMFGRYGDWWAVAGMVLAAFAVCVGFATKDSEAA